MLTLAGKPLTVPILQGGMGVGVSLGGLAGAVAACGGMGCISTADAGYREPDFARDPASANHRALTVEIKKAKQIAKGAGMVAINAMVATQDYAAAIRTAVEAGVDAVVSGAGLPLELPARGSLLLFTCTARESEALPLPPTYLSLAAPDFALADEDAAHLTKTYRATLQITATELQTATPLLTLPGQEMAELTVNGQQAGVSFWPPHKFPLAGLLTPGENTLTLTLTGSPANRYGKHPVPYGLER